MRARRGKTFQSADGVPYPLADHGKIIGRPYQGTHNHPDADDDKHNWGRAATQSTSASRWERRSSPSRMARSARRSVRSKATIPRFWDCAST